MSLLMAGGYESYELHLGNIEVGYTLHCPFAVKTQNFASLRKGASRHIRCRDAIIRLVQLCNMYNLGHRR